MSVTKRKYTNELERYSKETSQQVRQLADILPYEYNGTILFNLYKKFFPYEWKELSEMLRHYSEKDKHLASVHKKMRYKSPSPEDFFTGLPAVKQILSSQAKREHKENYDPEVREKKYEELWKKRESAIKRRSNKLYSMRLRMGLYFTQLIEPLYADSFIKAYHRKGCTTAEKLEIVIDLAKYDCPKVVEFFYKLNDAERNNQIRKWAFRYLQACGLYVRLRKNFKGKKKSYTTETADFNVTPQDLVDRFSRTSVQNLMSFDVFISHSVKDRKYVQEIINKLNKEYGLTCYCDWGVDNDFLKREMVGDNTKKALERRLRQSKALLYVNTENSRKSQWVQWELEYFKKLNKPMYCISNDTKAALEGFRDISELAIFHK